MAIEYVVRITTPDVDPADPAVAERDSSYFTIPTEDVRRVTFKYGDRPVNALGHVATPGLCVLTLYNEKLIYQQFADTNVFDKLPGAIIDIKIIEGGRTIQGWRGWLKDVLGSYDPNAPYFVQVIGQGALRQLDSVYDEIYTQVGGDLLTGAAIRHVLTSADWQYPTRIDDGRTQLDNAGGRLNRTQGLFQSGAARTAVSALQAIEVCCQAEVGRAYDDNFGTFVFEDRTRRSLRSIITPIEVSDAQVKSFEPASFQEGIINEIRSDGTKLVTGSRGVLTDSHFAIGASRFPHTIEVPTADGSAAGRAEKLLYVNRESVVRFSDLGDAVHNGGSLVRVIPRPDGNGNIKLVVLNFSALPKSVTITSIEGQSWEYDEDARGRVLGPKRHEPSIRRFGKISKTFPATLVVTEQGIIDALDDIIARHNGITRPEDLFRVDMTINANLNPQFLGVTVGNVLRVRNVGGFATHNLFVDSVQHDIEPTGSHDMTYLCSSTGVWNYWIAGAGRWGNNRRVGW